MSKRGEVLVAIINNLNDFADLRDQHWYRIPVISVEKWLRDCFPPDWIAFYEVGDHKYALDFSIYCIDGKVDVETDGDYWHHHPEKKEADTRRSNDLQIKGWHVIRFTSHQIRKDMDMYCVDHI